MANTNKKHKSNLDAALFALSLDPSAKATLQDQLIAGLRDLILADPKLSQSALPASRKLAEELSVSRTTVQAAYDQLISEGYLVTRQGSGTYVSENLPHLTSPISNRVAAKTRFKAWSPFQIGLADHTLFPHKTWARHLDRAWRNPQAELLAQPDPFGWLPLRQAITDHLAAWRGLQCQPEQVLITSGAWEGFEIIFRGILGAEPHVAMEDPGWPTLRQALTTMGMRVTPIRIAEDGLDPSQIPAQVSAVIVTPSRHYPTGVTMPLSRRVALLDWARTRGGIVLEDDYDSEFRYRGQPLPSLAGLDDLQHTFYMGSFSKLLSAALRIGYIVLPHAHVEAARRYCRNVGARASLVPQPALATFMQSGEFATHLRRMRRIYAKRHVHLMSELSALQDMLDFRADYSGMHICAFLTARLQDTISDQAISDRAKKDGLDIRALSTHCALPNPSLGLLLGFAAFEEERLTQAMAKLRAILKGASRSTRTG